MASCIGGRKTAPAQDVAAMDTLNSEIQDKYAGLRYAPDTVDLMNEIAVKFPAQWREIGRGLGLEEHELAQIHAQHAWQQDTNRLFSAVFNRWYRGARTPYTWEKILKVLCQPVIDGENSIIAESLRKKFWKDKIVHPDIN